MFNSASFLELALIKILFELLNIESSISYLIFTTEPIFNVFKLIFKTENLKVIPDSYVVEISSKGISTWTSTTSELKYWVTIETSSKFGG